MYKLDDLLEMKLAELIELGNSEFDLGVSNKFNKTQIASLIIAAQIVNNEGVEVEGVMAVPEEVEKADDLPVGYCIMRIQKSKRNPEGMPVPIGLNGSISIAPVEKNFRAPEHVIEILSQAMEEQLTGTDEKGRPKTSWAHAYPFTVMRHNPSPKWPKIQKSIDEFQDSLKSSFTKDVEFEQVA